MSRRRAMGRRRQEPELLFDPIDDEWEGDHASSGMGSEADPMRYGGWPEPTSEDDEVPWEAGDDPEDMGHGMAGRPPEFSDLDDGY